MISIWSNLTINHNKQKSDQSTQTSESVCVRFLGKWLWDSPDRAGRRKCFSSGGRRGLWCKIFREYSLRKLWKRRFRHSTRLKDGLEKYQTSIQQFSHSSWKVRRDNIRSENKLLLVVEDGNRTWEWEREMEENREMENMKKREREWKEGERFNRRKSEEGEQSNAGY